jgi:hypothetical protein
MGDDYKLIQHKVVPRVAYEDLPDAIDTGVELGNVANTIKKILMLIVKYLPHVWRGIAVGRYNWLQYMNVSNQLIDALVMMRNTYRHVYQYVTTDQNMRDPRHAPVPYEDTRHGYTRTKIYAERTRKQDLPPTYMQWLERKEQYGGYVGVNVIEQATLDHFRALGITLPEDPLDKLLTLAGGLRAYAPVLEGLYRDALHYGAPLTSLVTGLMQGEGGADPLWAIEQTMDLLEDVSVYAVLR